MVPVRMINVWLHFKHLILFKSEVFKLKLKHLIHLFSFKFAIYARHCCSVWKAFLNSFSFIIPSTSTCGEKSVKEYENKVNIYEEEKLFNGFTDKQKEMSKLLITSKYNNLSKAEALNKIKEDYAEIFNNNLHNKEIKKQEIIKNEESKQEFFNPKTLF